MELHRGCSFNHVTSIDSPLLLVYLFRAINLFPLCHARCLGPVARVNIHQSSSVAFSRPADVMGGLVRLPKRSLPNLCSEIMFRFLAFICLRTNKTKNGKMDRYDYEEEEEIRERKSFTVARPGESEFNKPWPKRNKKRLVLHIQW